MILSVVKALKMKGYKIQFFHINLKGKTSTQKAQINLPFEDGWGDMIYWATIYKTKNNGSNNS